MIKSSLIEYAKETLPELKELNFTIGGVTIPIGKYELINALLIKNNILDNENQNIAIFHSNLDLLDIFLLLIAGLSAYEESINFSSKLKIIDFVIDELIEFNGKIGLFKGTFVDPFDNIEKFIISYNDKYHTTVSLPMRQFISVSKYQGTKTTADAYDTKNKNKPVRDALATLFDLKTSNIGLSGYPSFLVVSERAHFIDILKLVCINHMSFFDIFPSVKCTSGSMQRLGRDSLQRGYMFYFASNLSAADDVLSSVPEINSMLVDARSKPFNNGSLLSSIRSQYGIEDIYWLQNYDRLDVIQQLNEGLNFKSWIWSKNDLADYKDFPRISLNISEEVTSPTNLVNLHKSVPIMLAKQIDEIIEIPYPGSYTSEQENRLERQIKYFFVLNEDFNNPNLLEFTIFSAGLVNKIFQSPVSLSLLKSSNSLNEKKDIHDELSKLIDFANLARNGGTPDDFESNALVFVEHLKSAIDVFYEYRGKLNEITKIIRSNSDKKICILSKYGWMSDLLKISVTHELAVNGIRYKQDNIIFCQNPNKDASAININLWTYKPQLKLGISIDPNVGRNILLLYPLQKEKFNTNSAMNTRVIDTFSSSKYRSSILHVREEFIDDSGIIQHVSNDSCSEEPIDLDNILTSGIRAKLSTYNKEYSTDTVSATLVIFSGGEHAFFQKGFNIRTLDNEQRSIKMKTVTDLVQGDEVVFLNNSKRTIFDEMVEFYKHKPEIVELVKTSELWRNALIQYMDDNFLTLTQLQEKLEIAGLKRNILTLHNWVSGTTIYPSDSEGSIINIIARITGNSGLVSKLTEIDDAARKLRALNINIGKYLSKRITQSYISPESLIDDPVLREKLDDVSRHVRIANVSIVEQDPANVPAERTNRLISEEDI